MWSHSELTQKLSPMGLRGAPAAHIHPASQPLLRNVGSQRLPGDQATAAQEEPPQQAEPLGTEPQRRGQRAGPKLGQGPAQLGNGTLCPPGASPLSLGALRLGGRDGSLGPGRRAGWRQSPEEGLRAPYLRDTDRKVRPGLGTGAFPVEPGYRRPCPGYVGEGWRRGASVHRSPAPRLPSGPLCLPRLAPCRHRLCGQGTQALTALKGSSRGVSWAAWRQGRHSSSVQLAQGTGDGHKAAVGGIVLSGRETVEPWPQEGGRGARGAKGPGGWAPPQLAALSIVAGPRQPRLHPNNVVSVHRPGPGTHDLVLSPPPGAALARGLPATAHPQRDTPWDLGTKDRVSSSQQNESHTASPSHSRPVPASVRVSGYCRPPGSL